MKMRSLLLAAVMTFLLSGLAFSQKQDTSSWREMLSYTEDQTWYAKKDWKNGLSEVTQSRQAQPWRQGTWKQKIDLFITQLQTGDRKAFLYVEYALLDGYGNPMSNLSVKGYPTTEGSTVSDGVLRTLYAMAKKQNTKIEKILTKGDPKVRSNVVKATLSGLFNKDPRVRLVAVNLLRRLRPDAMMARDVRRALLLETVTTERSKWREKDIDVPSIEKPRLGYGAVAWDGSSLNSDGEYVPTDIRDRFVDDAVPNGTLTQLLDGNGKGRYLVEGLYKKTERNDFPVNVKTYDFADRNDQAVAGDRKGSYPRLMANRRVWTKASLLRYGADEHVSSFESHYGFADIEIMPRHVYLYIDYRDPETGRLGEKIYYGFHSVWEEMKKLDLFVTRTIWVDRIKRGDVNALRILSKDSFRTLADQIDGESLIHVPMKSPKFKIFGEAEARAIIVGMLENRVVSTREECVRFLKRLFDDADTSIATKREIKKALREARRRELIIDTIRGRHLHAELVVPKQPDDWWGEEDELDTTRFGGTNRGRWIQLYRNQVEFPEETEIIYAHRRKPGAADEFSVKAPSETPYGQEWGHYGHPLINKANEKGEINAVDFIAYFNIEEWANYKGTKRVRQIKSLSEALLSEMVYVFGNYTNNAWSGLVGTEKADFQAAYGKVEQMELDGYDQASATEDQQEQLSNAEITVEEWWGGTFVPRVQRDGKEAELVAAINKYIAANASGQPAPEPPGQFKPGQSAGLKNAIASVHASMYDNTRAVEVLHSLLLGNGSDLLKASYLDIQNAVNIITQLVYLDGRDSEWLVYLIAGAQSVDARGRRYHDHRNLGAELERIGRSKINLKNFITKVRKAVGTKPNSSVYSLNTTKLGLKNVKDRKAHLGTVRENFYNSLPADERNIHEYRKTDGVVPPGRSSDRLIDGVYPVNKELSSQRFGKYYGHGRGGYYGFYDQQARLSQAELYESPYNSGVERGFYQFKPTWKLQRNKIVGGILVALGDKDPQKRLILVHLLRRLIPDASMLPRVNKLLRELETVDKRPYRYIDSFITVDATNSTRVFRVQEKIVGHELLKLQRFIVRRILVNKIKGGNEPDFLKEIPKGSFLTLVVRIDAEWDPYRIPLRSPIARNATGTNGMFFTLDDVDVIKGGLENRNFLVQRETARWLIDFYNYQRQFAGLSRDNAKAKKFIRAVKFAERRDVVYFERNYVQWEYNNDFSMTQYISQNPKRAEYNVARGDNNTDPTIGTDVYGAPVGRIAVRVNTVMDSDIFYAIDQDRKKEFVARYGRLYNDADSLNRFEEYNATQADLDGEDSKIGDVRKYYHQFRKERDTKKSTLENTGELTPAQRDERDDTINSLDYKNE